MPAITRITARTQSRKVMQHTSVVTAVGDGRSPGTRRRRSRNDRGDEFAVVTSSWWPDDDRVRPRRGLARSTPRWSSTSPTGARRPGGRPPATTRCTSAGPARRRTAAPGADRARHDLPPLVDDEADHRGGGHQLVEECVLRLDDPVDALLPELADRRVLRDPPDRSTTRCPRRRSACATCHVRPRPGAGHGVLGPPAAGPGAMAASSASAPGRRRRSTPRRPTSGCGCSAAAASYQPGERWLYHIGADVAGVLVRAGRRPAVPEVLRERIFEPPRHADTGSTSRRKLDRFGPLAAVDPASGALCTYDQLDGQWSTPAGVPGRRRRARVDDRRLPRLRPDAPAGGTAGGQRILARPPSRRW